MHMHTHMHTHMPQSRLICCAPVYRYRSVHLPFCKRKCFYCDFPVEAIGQNVERQGMCLCLWPD